MTCHTRCKLILIIKASYSVPCWEVRHFYSNKLLHQNTHLIPNICSQIMKTQKASKPLSGFCFNVHAHYMINYYKTLKSVRRKFCWCRATVLTLFVGYPKKTRVLWLVAKTRFIEDLHLKLWQVINNAHTGRNPDSRLTTKPYFINVLATETVVDNRCSFNPEGIVGQSRNINM